MQHKPTLAFFALLTILIVPAAFAGEGAASNCQKVIQNGDKTIILGPLGSRSYLGVELTSLTPELRRHFGAAEDNGIMVSRVDDESPALTAGLRVGDILTHIDGEAMQSAGQLGRTVRGHQGGDVVRIDYLRDGAAQSTRVTLAERERCVVDLAQLIPDDIHVQGLEALEAIDWEQIGMFTGEAVEQAMEAARMAMDNQDWEKMAENWERWGEKFGEEWGEKFGKEFGEKFSEEHMEKLEERMKELEIQLEEMAIELEKNFDVDVRVTPKPKDKDHDDGPLKL